MENYDLFKQHILNAVDTFREIPKEDVIRVVSHLDADGISACSILIKALDEENRKYVTSIVQQLSDEVIDGFAREEYKHFIFTDLGSGNVSQIAEKLHDRKVIILDHHEVESKKTFTNVTHVNPHLFSIDGGREISGAGVVYMFASLLNKKNKSLAHIAIIGAIGDIQEDKGFMRLNNEILEIAKKIGSLKVKEGLRVFGSQTRPLHKVLEYSTDPFIPGICGSESNAIQFLHQMGINPKNGTEWRKLIDLNDDEMKRLIAAIIMKRSGEEHPEDVLGYSYILENEQEGSALRDAKEFATLLNACGRLGKASIGIGACLNDPKIKIKAIQTLASYKKEIVNAMNWYRDNKKSSPIIKEKGFVIINAEDNVMASMIGTLASMLSKSDEFEEGTFIMSMAQAMDNTTKISLRLAGRRPNDNIDLHEIINEITSKAGGESGGHCGAAGAVIKTGNEEHFVAIAKEVLAKKVLEEKVV